MSSKTKTDVQINTSYWILLFKTNNNKKPKMTLMLKIYYILAILCSHVSSF